MVSYKVSEIFHFGRIKCLLTLIEVSAARNLLPSWGTWKYIVFWPFSPSMIGFNVNPNAPQINQKTFVGSRWFFKSLLTLIRVPPQNIIYKSRDALIERKFLLFLLYFSVKFYTCSIIPFDKVYRKTILLSSIDKLDNKIWIVCISLWIFIVGIRRLIWGNYLTYFWYYSNL